MGKTLEEYQKEYRILTDMFRCSTRYIYSKECEASDDTKRQMVEDIKRVYSKYTDRLEKKCMKNTGQNIHTIPDELKRLRT